MVKAVCSAATADEVIRQRPAAGQLAAPGAAINLRVSSGEECRAVDGVQKMILKLGIGIP